MTEQRRTALKELQKLDLKIQESRKHIHDFDPLLEEVEEPALRLESELGTSRTRLQEMKLESRRLELATEEKRERQKRLEERIQSVRNLREEAAVSAELEMVKRGLQNDEQEAYTLLDQLSKVEARVAEVEVTFAEANALVGPQRDALLAKRAEAQSDLESLTSERERFVASMSAGELKTYDAIRAGGRRIAVAELTEDGACGHCFGIIPLQLQNEVRHGASLIRCEGCGVILAAPEPIPEGGTPETSPPAPPAADDDDAVLVAEGLGDEGEGPEEE
jgi:predicted  nucleic acid-binding Zn-ribbon protein